jgi:amino acid transporter
MFYNATKSFAATDVMAAIMVNNLTASSIAVLATASRQLWAFACNGGLPFSHWLALTVLLKDIPLHALFVSLCFTICFSLINIGSSAALNAIFAPNTGSLITSYLITIGCTILHRLRGKSLPHARFSLGKLGLPINIAAVCYLLPIFIFSFPAGPKPTPVTMNWALSYTEVSSFFARSTTSSRVVRLTPHQLKRRSMLLLMKWSVIMVRI